MLRSGIGILEYWSYGVMGLKEFCIIKKVIFHFYTHYSNIPSFQNSIWIILLFKG